MSRKYVKLQTFLLPFCNQYTCYLIIYGNVCMEMSMCKENITHAEKTLMKSDLLYDLNFLHWYIQNAS